jgi:acyl-CoA reductase-like NAD-dependent aldehyde dehydrogenase
MKIYSSLINGKLVATDRIHAVINPATGEPCGNIALADATMAKAALIAAENASKTYSKLSINQRAALIGQLKKLLLEHQTPIVELLIAETGKTTGIAEYDFNMLVDCLDYFIEEVKRKNETIIPDYDGNGFHYLKHSPVGVVAAFLAWNFPLLNLGYKLGPILATGNCSIIKPAQLTPLSTAYVGELIQQCDFPDGTVNILLGSAAELSKTICSSPIPRLLTMIGSTPAGLQMVADSTTSIKRFSLELGGNAPVIVFEDADIDSAVNQLVDLKFSNAGQICVAPNRIFIHEKIYDKFISKITNLVTSYRNGSGDDSGNILSPVISERSLERLISLVDKAVADGAKLITGGKRADRKGFFLEPTLLVDATTEMALFTEEIFGPIIALMPFNDDIDIFEVANDTDAGLSAYVFTDNRHHITTAQERLQYGNILINKVVYSIQLPHGGLKQSGFGKDISHLTLDDLYDIKRISIS